MVRPRKQKGDAARTGAGDHKNQERAEQFRAPPNSIRAEFEKGECKSECREASPVGQRQEESCKCQLVAVGRGAVRAAFSDRQL
jgi:hypothetical protein